MLEKLAKVQKDDYDYLFVVAVHHVRDVSPQVLVELVLFHIVGNVPLCPFNHLLTADHFIDNSVQVLFVSRVDLAQRLQPGQNDNRNKYLLVS